MIRRIRQFMGNNVLLKITSVNSLAIGVRIVAGFITSKVVAIYLGAPGMALLGDLRNFMGSVQSIGTLGISNGVIKYTAEFKEDKYALSRLLSTSFFLILGTTLLVSGILFFGAEFWSGLVFKHMTGFIFVFKLMALALPLYAINTFLLAVINGYGKYKLIIFINIAINVLSLLVTAGLIITHQIVGAFIAIATVPALAILITLLPLIHKSTGLRLIKPQFFRTKYLKKYMSYTGMTVVSAMLTPWIFIGIRQHIINVDGMIEAGYWDAMLRLSDYYLMFATTVLTLYVLPKLASARSDADFRRQIFDFYKTIMPLLGLGLITVFLLKGYLVRLIFTTDFLSIVPLFKWQLAGDFFRVASIAIAYQFIAKNMFWYFVGTNLLSLAIIYGSSLYFIDHYGFVGAGIAHFFSYVLYLGIVLFIFRKPLFNLR